MKIFSFKLKKQITHPDGRKDFCEIAVKREDDDTKASSKILKLVIKLMRKVAGVIKRLILSS